MNRVLAVAISIGASTGMVAVLGGRGSSSDEGALSTSGSNAGSSSASSKSESGTLTVFAAASLKKTFTELGKQFETAHPGVKVTFSFAGSSDLVTQLQQGAPADIFASADTKNMDKATNDKLVAEEPTLFASNTLQIAVPPKNPKGINSLTDLTKPGLKVVICAPQVPCGSATKTVEKAANVTLKPASEESSVTDVLNKVTAGEADAGLIYRTDVAGADGKVEGIDFAQSSEAVNKYPIAALSSSKQADLAKQFIALVTGTAGQKVLADAGFAKP
ncbi:molybdate transport system substrate-binding protein [Calidifontibacter indicus]|uniref:Molybdate-binding protein ModA n=2 Tax=Calidifontibacter indicus TaxID=419650 RepID=A0A3D9URY0_9MICO|nr:molybdate transport system substrate-binding protein [Calidifontibacter indicus]